MIVIAIMPLLFSNLCLMTAKQGARREQLAGKFFGVLLPSAGGH